MVAIILPVDDSSLVEVVQSEGDLCRIEPAKNIYVVLVNFIIFCYTDMTKYWKSARDRGPNLPLIIIAVAYQQSLPRCWAQNRIQDIACFLVLFGTVCWQANH
jgi:hypothetical protein